MRKSRERNSMRRVSVKIEDSQIDELKKRNNELMRSLADLQNYMKITQKEAEATRKTVGMDIIKQILPVLDSLDAGINSSKDTEILGNIRNGLLQSLEKFGLKAIETEGKLVDIKFHEVVGVVDGEVDNKIIHEIQKGYILNNEVIRTSKVIVSKR
jgi:molecular chaperone GrpE